MTRIQYFSRHNLCDLENTIVMGQVLIVTGDISNEVNVSSFLDWCSDRYEQTYIVMGNEDYYSGLDVSDTLMSYVHFVRANVAYVNNFTLRIEDVELFFTTMWRECGNDSISSIILDSSDFEQIICNGRIINAEVMTELHQICKEWLVGAVLQSSADRKIVITHHKLHEKSSLAELLKYIGVDKIIYESE